MPSRFSQSPFVTIIACTFSLTFAQPTIPADEIRNIGMQRELFVDRFLIESTTDGVQLQVQQPVPREVVLVTGEPWEGNTCAYYSIFQDGNLYRMYYRGSHAVNMKSAHEEVTCYAESSDGIHWTKPKLNLFEWDGSTENNIVWKGLGTHCFTPFLDTNPDCPSEAKYKAISRGRPVGKKGLYVFKSPDGIHWSLLHDQPVITEGAFDSQNLAFWDPHTEQYVDYHRTFTNGVRSILMCTSSDFVNWSKPTLLTYPNAPDQHLYTNAIRPCPGAEHIRIGFPTRFIPATQQVEPVFMASRDGVSFHRFDQAIIPQTAPEDRDGNRSNYMTNGLLTLPNNSDEWSVYATEAYYSGPDSRVRRFAYRREGLAALAGTGEVLTKRIRFSGNQLHINYRCTAAGSLKISICDEDGTPLPNLASDQHEPLTSDSTNQLVVWKAHKNNPLSEVSGRTVRLKLTLTNAELFALQFTNEQ